MTYRTPKFWQAVRVYVGDYASRWNCGREGRALYELVNEDDWREYLEELAPKSRTHTAQTCASIIVQNYFTRNF